MTIASFPLVRGRFGAVVPSWRLVLAWLAVPLAFGWFAFALLDSVANFAPQEIRLSANGEYDPYLDDFVVFYSAGAMVIDGRSDELFEPESLRQAQARELTVPTDSIIQLPFYNPPAFALPLAALSLLPMGAAALAWTSIQVGALAGAFGALWLKQRRNNQRVIPGVILLAVLSSMPFHETVLHGQISLLFVAAWVALWFGAFERRNDGLVVAAITVFAIKPQLAVVPLAYLILTRRWRALAWAAGVQVLLAVVASAAFGVAAHFRWLALLLEATTWEDENGIWIHAMFGWNAFVRAFLGEDHQLVRSAVTAALTVGTIAFCLRRAATIHKLRQPELLAMLVFASVLMSPHLFAQDLMLPAAPLALLALVRVGPERTLWLAFGGVGWLLTFLHFDILMGSPDEFSVNLVSLWLAVGVLLSGWLLCQETVPAHQPASNRAVARPQPHLALQLGLAAVIALTLFATIPGFAGQKMANAIEYSYSAVRGPTYRIVIVGLSNE